MLHYMLESDAGCDAWITPVSFVVQYGWHLSHHRYYSDVAVEVTSWLVERVGGHRGVLAGSELPALDPVPSWRHGARAVWIDSAPEQITILVRAATSSALPATRPEPIESLRRIEYIAGSWPCPRCSRTPDRYRKLSDGTIVCLACGASSSMKNVAGESCPWRREL
jgi:hypothetical protein